MSIPIKSASIFRVDLPVARDKAYVDRFRCASDPPRAYDVGSSGWVAEVKQK